MAKMNLSSALVIDLAVPILWLPESEVLDSKKMFVIFLSCCSTPDSCPMNNVWACGWRRTAGWAAGLKDEGNALEDAPKGLVLHFGHVPDARPHGHTGGPRAPARDGGGPPVWKSGNIGGGDANFAKLPTALLAFRDPLDH